MLFLGTQLGGNDGVKTIVGSYVGDGTNSVNTPNKISCDGEIQCVIVSGDNTSSVHASQPLILIKGVTKTFSSNTGSSGSNVFSMQTTTWTDSSVSWYCTSVRDSADFAFAQHNSKDKIYYYIIFYK